MNPTSIGTWTAKTTQRERQDDERAAAQVVAEEDVLDHAGDHDVGEHRPPGDLEEAVPGEVLDPGERHDVADQQQRRGGEQRDRGTEGTWLGR